MNEEEFTNDPEELLKTVRYVLDDIPKRFQYNYDDIGRCDQEITDLLHVIEMIDFDKTKGDFLLNELKKVRLRRRELKDENDQLRPLVSIAEKYKSMYKEADKAIGEVRKIKSRIETRTYHIRIRDDLEEMFEEEETS